MHVRWHMFKQLCKCEAAEQTCTNILDKEGQSEEESRILDLTFNGYFNTYIAGIFIKIMVALD